MTKHVRFAIPLAVLIVFSCGSSKQTASAPDNILTGSHATQLGIDGKNADWLGIPVAASPHGTIQYSIANDAEGVYVMLKVADPAEQMKLLSSGLKIFIDPSEKKARTTEIVYPVKGELNQAEIYTQPENGAKLNKEVIHQRIAIQLISLDRAGFNQAYNGVQSIRQNTGFKAAIGWNTNDDLVYELVFPRKAIPGAVGDKIQLGFFIDAFERPNERAGAGGWNGERGGEGGMGRRGGGYRQNAGGNGSGSDRNRNLYTSESFWTTYQLARG